MGEPEEVVEADGQQQSYEDREGDTDTDRKEWGEGGREEGRGRRKRNISWEHMGTEREVGGWGSKQSFLYTAAPRSHLAAAGDDISRH